MWNRYQIRTIGGDGAKKPQPKRNEITSLAAASGSAHSCLTLRRTLSPRETPSEQYGATLPEKSGREAQRTTRHEPSRLARRAERRRQRQELAGTCLRHRQLGRVERQRVQERALDFAIRRHRELEHA